LTLLSFVISVYVELYRFIDIGEVLIDTE